MNEKISSELFSSVISRINQIPNNSTPFKGKCNSKPTQKLFQIYQLYNIGTTQQDMFNKIFSHISDYYLRNNLVKIMLNIGTKYNSFSTSNTNSFFLKYANDELLSLFADTWNYFNQRSEYLKNIELEENQYASEEYFEYDKSFKETICFTCGLINIVIFMFKKHFSLLDNYNKKININKSNETKNKITNQLSKEFVQTELNMLFILNKNRIWLEPLVTLLEQILKFFLNCNFYNYINMKLEKYRKKEKEGLITVDEIIQNINKYINYLIDDNNILKKIFTLVRRYSALNNINILTGSIIQINDLDNLIQRFFNIYIIFFMNKKNKIAYNTDEEMYCIGIYIIECLLNAKYKDKNYGIDFIGYFYSMENFMEETFDGINIKILNGINELNASISGGNMNITLPNLNLLQKYENTFKDYIFFTMISSNNKDSLCDSYHHHFPQRNMFINFGLLRAYLLMCKSIKKNMNFNQLGKNNIKTEKKKEIVIGNIFDDLINELRKYNINLPVKMFMFRSYFIQSILVVLYKYVKIFNKYILDANKDKLIFYNNISIIKEMSESVNNIFFLLGNDILNYLKYPSNFKKNNLEDNHKLLSPSLRIIDESNPLVYFNIVQEKIINASNKEICSQKIKAKLPSFGSSILNKLMTKKQNSNQKSNSIFCSNRRPNNIFSTGISDTNFTDNMDLESEDSAEEDNNINNVPNILFSAQPNKNNIFKSNIIQSEVKKRRSTISNEFLYRYDITEFIDLIKKELFPALNKIGFDARIENDKQYLYLNTDGEINPDINHIIYIGLEKPTRLSLAKMTMYDLIKNDSLSNKLVEQLFSNYIDGLDESIMGKNIEISLKYYDTNFILDYFEFVEKCKQFIL